MGVMSLPTARPRCVARMALLSRKNGGETWGVREGKAELASRSALEGIANRIHSLCAIRYAKRILMAVLMTNVRETPSEQEELESGVRESMGAS